MNRRVVTWVSILVGIILFIVNEYLDANTVFNTFFANEYTNTFTAYNQLLNSEKLKPTDIGYTELFPLLLNGKQITGEVTNLQVGGSGVGTTMRGEIISSHTIWFYGINEVYQPDKKLGEVSFDDHLFEALIESKYKTPILRLINILKSFIRIPLTLITIVVIPILQIPFEQSRKKLRKRKS